MVNGYKSTFQNTVETINNPFKIQFFTNDWITEGIINVKNFQSYFYESAQVPINCPIGSYGNQIGLSECLICPYAELCTHEGQIDYSCPSGKIMSSGLCSSCPEGYFCHEDELQKCPIGGFCPIGSSNFTSCPENYYGFSEGLKTARECTKLPEFSTCNKNDLPNIENCECEDGYQGSIVETCSNLNECLYEKCDPGLTCTDTVGKIGTN